MSYEMRGSYNHTKMARQLLRFDGLRYGNVTPMDVDGLIEWKNRKRAILEVKMKNVKVLDGERLALERMVNDFYHAGKEAIAIVADHTVFDAKEDVMVKDCLVREIYHSSEKIWRPTNRMMTVEMLLSYFLRDTM